VKWVSTLEVTDTQERSFKYYYYRMGWIFLLKLYRTVATALAKNCKKHGVFLGTRQMALASNIEDLPTQNRGAGT